MLDPSAVTDELRARVRAELWPEIGPHSFVRIQS
jgi:hypothetical protein